MDHARGESRAGVAQVRLSVLSERDLDDRLHEPRPSI
jgi:hypothetical protein